MMLEWAEAGPSVHASRPPTACFSPQPSDLCLSRLRGRPQGQLEFLGGWVGWGGKREQREWRRKNNSK